MRTPVDLIDIVISSKGPKDIWFHAYFKVFFYSNSHKIIKVKGIEWGRFIPENNTFTGSLGMLQDGFYMASIHSFLHHFVKSLEPKDINPDVAKG